MSGTGGAIIKHGHPPPDAEVAYKMQKIQITDKRNVATAADRIFRKPTEAVSRFRIGLRSVGDSEFVNPVRSAAYESVRHAPQALT
jgi:hypothetical protein